jgi:outer membrane protein assembly factor BamB
VPKHFPNPQKLLFVLAALITGLPACQAGDWPGWRGPAGTGYTDEKNLPKQWDGKTGKNVLWRIPLPKTTGHSSPIVSRDRVFLTTAVRQTEQEQQRKVVPEHHLWCLDARDGKVLWRKSVQPGKEPAGQEIYAAPTPVTDGKAVYCWFGSAVVAAVDFDGKQLWRSERAGPFKVNPGICSSPVIYKDTLLLLCDQANGAGWLLALDRATGAVKWERKRSDFSHTNATPLLITVRDKPQLVIQASSQLQALDPASGEPIWWCKATGFGSSPAYGAGLVYSDSGKDESGLVVSPTGQGDVTATDIKWQQDKIASQYQSAVIAGEYVYRSNKPGIIKCFDLASGKTLFSARAEGVPTVCSPIATADGLVYFVGANKSYVIKAGPKFELVATNTLGGGENCSSAAASNGRIFIRGDQVLFCLGEKSSTAGDGR